MKKSLLIMILIISFLLFGCTVEEENNISVVDKPAVSDNLIMSDEDVQDNASTDGLVINDSKEEQDVLDSEDDTKVPEEIDCVKYDSDRQGCLSHDNCEWYDDEGLCEFKDEDDGHAVLDTGWKTIIVDDSGWVGIDPIIAVDNNNNPHIAYYDQGNRDLKYAYFDGTRWKYEIVDSKGDCGEEPGIDIDSEGNPHISYEINSKSALGYATKKDGQWLLSEVDSISGDIEAMSTTLKIDSKDNVHIAYSFGADGNDVYTRYAYYDGRWKIEKIRSMGSDMIMDLDSGDIPHISSKKGGDNKERIVYTTKKSGEWITTIVDLDVQADADTGIAVDSKGFPHIIYNVYSKNEKRHATLVDGEWKISIIDTNTGENEGVKIAIDQNNVPHAVYSVERGNDQESLMHAYLSGDIWVREQVHMMGNPAIAIDSLGRIHIAHNSMKEEDPKKYDPDYDGDEEEIEILKYSVLGITH